MKRMKVYLVEEEWPTVELSDPDSNELKLRFVEHRLEIGWAEVQQMAEGRLEIEMTLVGSYEVETNYLPDLTKYKGTIPTSLRKG